ncbi:ABC transporter ATP-binding protein [Dysgonomonas sp. 520]|uniref:ABC transporter ATP-binding protein n=1 Tax=Dysgonomonas sp. 520 TaxID=2302931 RepID=UPI00162A5AC6|nr:ABC transporter ATP-binding protein [Dysgonomonas sp. 520]
MEQEVLISSQNLSIGYTQGKEKQVLYNNLSFDLFSGELTCLIGTNGAGKSTLFRTIGSLQMPLSGKILVKNKDVREYSEQELSQLMGLVLTDQTSVGGLKVKEVVSLGRYPYTGFWGKLSKEDKHIVANAMSDVGIQYKSKTYMAELSDGERQKVMIAKALAQECPIIILDEPTAFLDVTSRIEVMDLLHRLAVEKNKAVVMSTHDIELALMLADKLWLLSRENGLHCGNTEDIILSGQMSEFFSSDNILFEKQSGRFKPSSKKGRNVRLTASGDLQYWGRNILERKGYTIVEDKESAALNVIIESGEQITIETGNNTKTVSSFGELSDYLKELQ